MIATAEVQVLRCAQDDMKDHPAVMSYRRMTDSPVILSHKRRICTIPQFS